LLQRTKIAVQPRSCDELCHAEAELIGDQILPGGHFQQPLCALQDAARDLQHLFAGLCQPHGACIASHQHHAKRGFKRGDAHRYVGLRRAERCGCLAKGAKVGHGDKRLDLLEGDLVST